MSSLKQSEQNNNLLRHAEGYLFQRLQTAQIWLYRVNEHTGAMRRFPGKVRGNRAYAHHLRGRIENIRDILKKRLQTGENSSNGFFVTLTYPNPLDAPDTLQRLAEDFKEANHRRAKFFKAIRRKGATSYVYSVEATARGGFHVHAAIFFDRQMRTWADSNGVIRSDPVRDLVTDLWAYNVDVQAMTSGDLAGYITKELYKYSGAEDALRKLRAGEEITNGEKKRILTYALAHYAKIRLLGTSRDFPAIEDEAGEDDERLDYEGNNPPDEWTQTVVLTRREIVKLLKRPPPPWTGDVEPGTREHELILQIARSRREHAKPILDRAEATD